jgi:type IV secretory pathway TraG/TraD family ATPase VirD4
VRWVEHGRLTVGREEWGRRVSIPAGGETGAHTLILGATGSGKTCTEAWIAARLIEHGLGAVAIDPKGDEALRMELRAAAQRAGRPFHQWTPEGPLAYNPYAHGGSTELAEKALIAETFTEPHYLRLAQRYLEHATRSMLAAGVPVSPGSLMAHMDPAELERTARAAADMGLEGIRQTEARQTEEYVQSLTERQRRELAGVRDRLSILAESDLAPWLDPAKAGGTIDLAEAVRGGAVVYFALDADRRPLLARMLGGAIVADLISIAADRQRDPLPTVVVIDEFSAIAAELVARLFGRGRSAGFSLVLATQEMADLASVGQGAGVGRGSLRNEVMGNLASAIAFRQNVPESAELIAQMAGRRPAWIATQWTVGPLPRGPLGRGMRRRGLEPVVERERVMRLATGEALVVDHLGGQPPTVARMCHPGEARAPGSARCSARQLETGLADGLEAPDAIR